MTLSALRKMLDQHVEELKESGVDPSQVNVAIQEIVPEGHPTTFSALAGMRIDEFELPAGILLIFIRSTQLDDAIAEALIEGRGARRFVE